jgi:hypothetical protein
MEEISPLAALAPLSWELEEKFLAAALKAGTCLEMLAALGACLARDAAILADT